MTRYSFTKKTGKITIEKPVSREELAEGYRQYAAKSESLAAEMADVSREADEYLGDVPEW